MNEKDYQTIRSALDQSYPYSKDAIATLHKLKAESDRRNRLLELVKESLTQLRLDTKYLIFDLEATRRERDEYKFRLDGLDK